MADGSLQIGPNTRATWSGDTAFDAFAGAEATQRVWLWDIGPFKPVPPEKPELPKAKAGTPEYDWQAMEYRAAIADYEQAMVVYRAARLDYETWHTRYGGPIEHPMWSCNAQDALKWDALAVEEKRQPGRRWFISSRTRGYKNLPNHGLPEGMKPGRGQAENLRREAESRSDLQRVLREDPVFGAEQEFRQ